MKTYRVGGPLGVTILDTEREVGEQLVVDADSTGTRARSRGRGGSIVRGGLSGLLGRGLGRLGGRRLGGGVSDNSPGRLGLEALDGIRAGARGATLDLGRSGLGLARTDEAVVTGHDMRVVAGRRRKSSDSSERGQPRENKSLEMHSEKRGPGREREELLPEKRESLF